MRTDPAERSRLTCNDEGMPMWYWTRAIAFWLVVVLLPVAVIQWPGAAWLVPLSLLAIVLLVMLAVRSRRSRSSPDNAAS